LPLFWGAQPPKGPPVPAGRPAVLHSGHGGQAGQLRCPLPAPSVQCKGSKGNTSTLDPLRWCLGLVSVMFQSLGRHIGVADASILPLLTGVVCAYTADRISSR